MDKNKKKKVNNLVKLSILINIKKLKKSKKIN